MTANRFELNGWQDGRADDLTADAEDSPDVASGSVLGVCIEVWRVDDNRIARTDKAWDGGEN